MRPYVICHMVASLDGKTQPSRWSPRELNLHGAYEALHERLDGTAWLIGRVTGEEFAKGPAYSETDATFPRETWLARKDAASFAVVVDGAGRIAWGRADIGGDPIVVILTERVSDSHLAGLRRDTVSYVFAGRDELDLAAALETLRRELAIERLLVEGGGHLNGSMVRAGLIDEISLIVAPAIDGRAGAPSLFDGEADEPAPSVAGLQLLSSEPLQGGAIWLRYRLETNPAA